MSTETPPRRRILRPRLLVPIAVVVAAVIVVIVVAGSSGGPKKTDTIPVGDSPAGVATGEGSVWVADSGAGTLVRVDPNDKEVKG
jgi:streptogramin lyase